MFGRAAAELWWAEAEHCTLLLSEVTPTQDYSNNKISFLHIHLTYSY